MKQILAFWLLFPFALLASEPTEEDSLQHEQHENNISWGICLGTNLNMHSPLFQYNSSDGFLDFNKNKSNITGFFGIEGDYRFSKILVFSGSLIYNFLGTELESSVGSGSYNYKLDSKIHYIELSPALCFENIIYSENIYFPVGFDIGIPISQKYQIITNENIPRIIQNEISIPNASLRLGVFFGLGYKYQISPDICLKPELTYRLPFTQVSNHSSFDSWTIPQIRFNIGILFSHNNSKNSITHKERDYRIEVGMKEIRTYENSTLPQPVRRIKLEEVKFSELFPIIPYIFMDESRSEPSEALQTYHSGAEAGEFSISRLEPNSILINKSTLDILGVRMEQFKAANLTIIGTTDGKKEIKNKTLSEQRADFARDYLLKNFKINPNRIEIKSRILPEHPSSGNDPDAIAENRRVEFRSNLPHLLAPIVIEQDHQRISSPDLIEFVPYIKTNEIITSWNMEIYQASRLLQSYDGDGTPDPVQWSITPNTLQSSQIPIEWHIRVTSRSNLTAQARGTIPVEFYSFSRKAFENMPDKTISKFSLITFDFDKSEISSDNMFIIEQYILPALKSNSRVKIYGYTDRIGDPEYNKKLSLDRAISVRDVLESEIKCKYEVFGIGEQILLFNNDTPIGRHLSRTVQIIVETPK